ncbi:Phenylacetic acid degradation protein PaaY [Grimontia indica]|uniref:Phenylacetic acid degradation protein PaaY n=1 Tax=Grimontia indica TaxID=1056512 RepID=R1GTP5_9GAMM|nr:phenylacetic acid degradation protein PaaY [Grimontia indica]EOD79578.1 Phenylacetic acid degradation protein PaaY [Grimontia indica]
MPCYALDGISPVVEEGAYVHPEAVLIGDVIVEQGSYIAPFASLRGDFGRIHIKANANVQDNCVIHAFPGIDVVVHERGHIGHSAILHGCIIEEGALIGMNTVVMDGAVVGAHSIVAAHSLVASQQKIPSKMLALGSPAKVIRELREEEVTWKSLGTDGYIELTERCLATMQQVEPLKTVEADRKRMVIDESIKPKFAD